MPLFHNKHLRPLFLAIGIICWLSAIVVVIIPIFPYFLYRLSPNTPNQLAQNLADTVSSTQQFTDNTKPTLPPQDSTLPTSNTLRIASIGVDGIIHEGEDAEAVLRDGIWIVPNFATPESSQHPIILASHRWGYLDWTNTFRRRNSFYSLPKVENGERVDLIWNQRLYTYEIYHSENSDHITDYSADLILYTCELWNSPLRVFRYAKLIQ